MAFKTSRLPDVLPTTFHGLCEIHWPRPIHDAVDYDNAAELVDRLALLRKRTRDQEDYLEAISTLIEKYDREHFPIDDAADPIEALKLLLESHEMNASDLGRLLGNRTLGPAILRGQRKISRRNAQKLADQFKVNPAIFFQR